MTQEAESLLPTLLDSKATISLPVSSHELSLLKQARNLFDGGFYDHALLDIWNAAVTNLRSRVEAYGSDLWESVVKDEPGRKRYDKNGETVSERWSGVDDLVLIAGATRLGVLNKKAGKALEMISGMRNHASPAHDSDHKVEREDVIGLVLILQKNLFNTEMPDPGHSVSSLFDPVKTKLLPPDTIHVLADQIRGLKAADLRIAFGFLLNLLCEGEAPSFTNAANLFPVAWEKASDELCKMAGLRYHGLFLDPSTDTSGDKAAATRLLDFLTEVEGIRYIPDAVRARLYRRAAKKLADAKDSRYGWSDEEKAARTLAQFGPWVPAIAFEEVYQEIVSVWCGNYWGRSEAYSILAPFIDNLNTNQVRQIARLFIENERVQEELAQTKPKDQALALLSKLKRKLTISAHKDEIDEGIEHVHAL
jgi:hypothetical protein